MSLQGGEAVAHFRGQGGTEDRGQRIEKTEDRETQLSVFCSSLGAKRRKPGL
ncbi:MAG: hypothetical protein LBD06_08535 [Candidatus Accumulibacter sp.]|nr:hypothetical protein [Accumulibacter sp.]